MTGLEMLYEELKKRGIPKSQTCEKYVSHILDIISGSEKSVYVNLLEAENELKEKKRQVDLNRAKFNGDFEFLESARKELDKRKKAAEEYIEAWQKSIAECETAEGRDAMRIAQTFINSVNITTAYDNTAFIRGLASILSNGNIGPMDSLKKINTKLFESVGRKKPL